MGSCLVGIRALNIHPRSKLVNLILKMGTQKRKHNIYIVLCVIFMWLSNPGDPVFNLLMFVKAASPALRVVKYNPKGSGYN